MDVVLGVAVSLPIAYVMHFVFLESNVMSQGARAQGRWFFVYGLIWYPFALYLWFVT